MEMASTFSENIPTTFWKTDTRDEIHFFLNEAIKLHSGVSTWIMTNEKKIILGGSIKEMLVETGSIVINSVDDENFSIFKGTSAIFVYIPGKQRNILFKTFIKYVDDKKLQVIIPGSIFIHELRKEKRIYIPPEKNIEVYIGHSRNTEMVVRKTRLIDLSSKGIGLFLEFVGDPKIVRGDKMAITAIPVPSLKVPVNMEVCYINNYLLKVDSRTTLRGFRIGCKFLDQRIDLKKL